MNEYYGFLDSNSLNCKPIYNYAKHLSFARTTVIIPHSQSYKMKERTAKRHAPFYISSGGIVNGWRRRGRCRR